MSDTRKGLAAMERDEAHKRARWIEDANDSQELEYRLLAAMNIVERVYQLKRGRPEKTYDGSFMNPGEARAWSDLVMGIFKELGNGRKSTRRDDE